MKEKLFNEFKKVWGKDEKMIDFCMKKITGVVELENGGYFCFDKPSIETHFCFGYGQNGISTEEDFEFALQEKINASKKENFISENMKKFQFMEETLDYDGKVYAMELYNRSNSNLRGLKTDEEERIYGKMFGTVVSEITPVDRMNLKAELSNQKKKFMKRLETYWKRYGSSKLKTWTYLVD
jgi:hypothetical protein